MYPCIPQATIVPDKNTGEPIKGYIAMPFFGQMDLLSYIKAHKNRISLRDNYGIIVNMAEVIKRCHDFRIVHSDIKPRNLMIDNKNNVWLVDFGLSLWIPKDSNSTLPRNGTPEYAAPEILLSDAKPSACERDIFSFGMIILKLHGFDISKRVNIRNGKIELVKHEYTDEDLLHFKNILTKNTANKLIPLVKMMLSKNPKERPNALSFSKEYKLCEPNELDLLKLRIWNILVMLKTLLDDFKADNNSSDSLQYKMRTKLYKAIDKIHKKCDKKYKQEILSKKAAKIHNSMVEQLTAPIMMEIKIITPPKYYYNRPETTTFADYMQPFIAENDFDKVLPVNNDKTSGNKSSKSFSR